LVDFPEGAYGITVYDGIDEYDIYINARLSNDMIIKAYDHEIGHVNNHDFDKMYSAEYIEKLMSA